MATIAENIQTLRSIKSDIKNAITDKGGSIGNDFKTYAQAITNLPSGGGGGNENEDALVQRTISVYSNDRVSRVGKYAFAYCSNLTSINLPLCEYISSCAFQSCYSLTSVNLPKVTYIGINTFYDCSALTFISLPICSYVDTTAFYYCTSLPFISLPNCLSVGNNAFQQCSALSFISLPNCLSVNGFAFYMCNNLTQVYLNSVSSVTTIVSETFYNCPNLTSVYVPASLVDAFKTAENWTSLSNKIVAYREIAGGGEDLGGDFGGGDNIEID